MKLSAIFAYIAFVLSVLASDPCSIYGDNKRPEMRYADSLKNRPQIIQLPAPDITLQSLLAPGDDRMRFNSSTYVAITGYIVLVKYGGAETCNCHTKNKADLDTHIELCSTPDGKGKDCVICEINRFNTDTSLLYYNVLQLKGKKVQIDGYLFFDGEHKQNAVNTNPNGTFLWRATCWEIHPVCKITTL
jgi:hypothetical protein